MYTGKSNNTGIHNTALYWGILHIVSTCAVDDKSMSSLVSPFNIVPQS